jgi:hypothetical protein
LQEGILLYVQNALQLTEVCFLATERVDRTDPVFPVLARAALADGARVLPLSADSCRSVLAANGSLRSYDLKVPPSAFSHSAAVPIGKWNSAHDPNLPMGVAILALTTVSNFILKRT